MILKVITAWFAILVFIGLIQFTLLSAPAITAHVTGHAWYLFLWIITLPLAVCVPAIISLTLDAADRSFGRERRRHT